ncbi:MAG: amidohydrolase family protein [Anaerococcus sp.]
MLKDNIIIDAHLHLPWEDKYTKLSDKLARLKAELKENNIEYGIIIADSVLESTIGNNKECLDLLVDEKKFFMLYGFTPLVRKTSQLDEIYKLFKEQKIVGVKIYPNHEGFYVDSNLLDELYVLCESNKIPVAIHTEYWDNYKDYSNPERVKIIAENYQNLIIICCHSFWPKCNEALKYIIPLKNVYLETSALYAGNEIYKSHPGEFMDELDTIKFIQKLVQIIPHRVIYGSDYASCDLYKNLDLINKALNKRETKQLILFENAKKIYNLPV